MTTAAEIAAADERLRVTAREAARTWLRDRLVYGAPEPGTTAGDVIREHGPWLDGETFAQLASLV